MSIWNGRRTRRRHDHRIKFMIPSEDEHDDTLHTFFGSWLLNWIKKTITMDSVLLDTKYESIVPSRDDHHFFKTVQTTLWRHRHSWPKLCYTELTDPGPKPKLSLEKNRTVVLYTFFANTEYFFTPTHAFHKTLFNTHTLTHEEQTPEDKNFPKMKWYF